MINIESALSDLSWVPRPRITALRRLGLETAGDLLLHYPRRHEDRRQFPKFPQEELIEPICLCGEVVKTRLMRFGGRRIFEAVLQENGAHALSQPLTCRWFNLYYVQKMIAAGHQLVVFGRPRLRRDRLVMDHPEFEVIENDEEISIHFRRITPIYPGTEGVSQRALRTLVFRVLEQIEPDSLGIKLPRQLRAKERPEALRHIHFPESEEQLAEVRDHLVLGEFFRMQVHIAAERARTASRPGYRHSSPGKLLRQFLAGLPFDLTPSQTRVLDEIKRDLAVPAPMNRLLQGDVGSGKTVVAIAAMLLAVEAGSQAALMAPTQILAEQHYVVLRRWLDPLRLRIALRTGSRQEESFLPLMEGGEWPQIIVGTHALLYEGVRLQNLGLAVIDEQHKFGVSQRARLTSGEPPPDVLVMTATPIPRTLTMTIYGDLEVSTITEIPAGRGEIQTRLLTEKGVAEAVSFLRSALGGGAQAYIVYPLIEESDKLDVKAAAEEFKEWNERLRPFRCELLHGRIPALQKQAIMERFRTGETNVLVSTTVIEVGVDVPNASVMLIENAERFGLSQLHQLRGRIGRGARPSHCLVVSTEKSPETVAKLSVFERTTDGFAIAEADWDLRGPGDLLGTAQSGLAEFKLGDLKRDAGLMRRARTAALALFDRDPQLEQAENKHFRSLVVERQGQTFSRVS